MTGIDRTWRLFDCLPLPALCLDTHDRVTRFNLAAERLLGPISSASVRWMEQQIAPYSAVPDLEYCFETVLRLHGVEHRFRVHVKRVSAADDAFGLPRTVAMLEDVTSEKRLAQRLHEANARLEEAVDDRTAKLALANESVRHYAAECKAAAELVRNLSEAVRQSAEQIIITDPHGCIQFVNEAFEDLTGYSLAEIAGKNPRILRSDQHPPSFYADLWKTISQGNNFRAEFINRKKNGEFYVEDKIITPIKDSRGVVTNYVSTGRTLSLAHHIPGSPA